MRQKLYQKTVLVVGTGISGIGATKLLLEAEALPILYDSNQALDIAAVQEKLKTKQEVLVYADRKSVV